MSPGKGRIQVLVDLVEKALGGQPGLIRANQKGQVLGHMSILDCFHHNLFKGFRKIAQGRV